MKNPHGQYIEAWERLNQFRDTYETYKSGTIAPYNDKDDKVLKHFYAVHAALNKEVEDSRRTLLATHGEKLRCNKCRHVMERTGACRSPRCPECGRCPFCAYAVLIDPTPHRFDCPYLHRDVPREKIEDAIRDLSGPDLQSLTGSGESIKRKRREVREELENDLVDHAAAVLE